MSEHRQFLHWVFKIGSLKRSLAFFEGLLGMHILRHEEFNDGCEASCNGKYARPWSKTMIGFAGEDKSFVLELTYNYGIRKYPLGDDLREIVITDDPTGGLIPRIRAQGEFAHTGVPESEGGGVRVTGPDGHTFRVVPSGSLGGSQRKERFVRVEIRTSDLERSVRYYTTVCGMTATEGENDNQRIVAYDPETQCALLLTETDKGKEVDHAKAIGRLAISTVVGPEPVHDLAKGFIASEGCSSVIHEPLALDTPGKATVQVAILGDPDGYEICFVGAKAFFELAKRVEGGDKVDWEARKEAGAGDDKA